jgi:hypothetical protein
VRHHAEHVGAGAKGGVDLVEQLLALGRRGVAVDQGEAVHGGLLGGGLQWKSAQCLAMIRMI